jgi:hypothetical protein
LSGSLSVSTHAPAQQVSMMPHAGLHPAPLDVELVDSVPLDVALVDCVPLDLDPLVIAPLDAAPPPPPVPLFDDPQPDGATIAAARTAATVNNREYKEERMKHLVSSADGTPAWDSPSR